MTEFEYGDGKKQVVLDKVKGEFIVSLLDKPVFREMIGFERDMTKEQILTLIDIMGAICVPPRTAEDIISMDAEDFIDFLVKMLPHLERFMNILASKFPKNSVMDITL